MSFLIACISVSLIVHVVRTVHARRLFSSAYHSTTHIGDSLLVLLFAFIFNNPFRQTLFSVVLSV